VHSRAVVAEALRLRDGEGLGAVRAARRLGLPVATVRDWHGGKLPRHSRQVAVAEAGLLIPAVCPRCGHAEHDFDSLPHAYAYLLGLYLGDGCISEHRRRVHKLRVFLDLSYPAIIEQCARAIREVMPANKVHRQERSGSFATSDEPSNVEVSSFSKSWPCLFPQHGPGPKHERRIWLAPWQQRLAERWPGALLRGLIHSDGCRFTNTRGSADSWSAPRYAFTNVSTDITGIFCTACDRLGLRWTAAFPASDTAAVAIYVSRKDDVARMDELIGPKR
jgi:hypothetical protein